MSLFTLLLVPGCGDDSASGQAKQKTSSQQESSTAKTSKTKASSRDTRKSSGANSSKIVRTDSDGRKWIDDIPYDVYFDNPLEIANDNRSAAPASNGTSVASTGTKTTNGTTSAGGNSDSTKGTDWQSIISMEILEAEVKSIRNSMTAKLRALGQYNSGYKDLQIDGATLAAVAAIIIEHPDSISWKEDARYVRELGAQVEAKAQRLGKQSFDETKIPFEQFVSILNRSKPAGLPEVEEKVPFAHVIERGSMMRRFDKAFQALKSNVPSETALKDQAEMAIHESTILAALTRVIMTEDYDLTDDKEFLSLATQMFESSRAVTKAVQEENFEEYQKALSNINNACTQCHTSYRD